MPRSNGDTHDPDKVQGALQDLLERVGDQVDVLRNLNIIADALEGRHLRLAKGLVIMVAVATIFNVGALFWSENQVSEIHETQNEIQNTAEQSRKEARHFGSTNRSLIRRLERVAVQAQMNGARADRIQCREIERLKRPIRIVLREVEADRFLPLFKPKKCSALPNAKVVKP